MHQTHVWHLCHSEKLTFNKSLIDGTFYVLIPFSIASTSKKGNSHSPI